MADTIGEVECLITGITIPDNTIEKEPQCTISLSVPYWNRYSLKYIHDKFNEGKKNGKEAPLHAQFFWYKEKRSLNANSYFHVLVDKIAKIVGTSESEMKKQLVLEYGTPAMQNGREIVVTLPVDTNVDDFYPYAKWIGAFEDRRGGNIYDQYIFFKQTHTLDRGEMAKLIDGTVQEARSLGIDTRTDDEVERLISKWGEEK